MAVRNLADIVKIGSDVLSTTQSTTTGLVTAQLGDVVSEVPSSDDAEWYFPPGVVARPRAPDAGKKAAQVIAVTRANHDAIVGMRDERVQQIVGTLDDGETAVFASAENGGVAVFKKDGSIAVTAGDGSASVTVKNGGIVQVGDSNAAFVAPAKAIKDLQTAINGWMPVANDGGAALKTALAAWLAATYSTTKGQMT
jgi:hypothetical protein